MDTSTLWKMDTATFNLWRKQNDYPKLFSLFQEILPDFDAWLESQNLTTDIIFDNGFARFIGAREPLILCTYDQNQKHLFDESLENLPGIRKAGWILSEERYEPYFYWLEIKRGTEIANKTKQEFRISSWINGRPKFCNKIFLLYLGRIHIRNASLADRHLDFCCLDGLILESPHNNKHLYIWYSSAIGLEISGGVAFLNFYNSCLRSYASNNKFLLRDGIYQDIHFFDSEVRMHLCRSKLHMSSILGINLECSLEYAEIEDVKFDGGKILHKNYQGHAAFYSKAKSLYSNIGNKAEAGNYFYKEKKHELIAQLFPKITHHSKLAHAGKIKRLQVITTSYLTFLSMLSNYITWGFGERPIRSLFLSIWLVIGSSIIYYLAPQSSTVGQAAKSLYFSLVTFVTLGYGDITQSSAALRIFSSLEAFAGMFLIGIFLAGYASKTKNY
ncbi:potassium channel family protein [Ectopseudomonas toyotomiensis]|uniref:potassium channel family protein n=1 Tax=Ectopseudomonas toyotomiensis TaxID=554344 RepID=UPI003D148608